MEWIQFIILMITFIGMVITFFWEQKSFHGRLCALEEKYIQIMQRVWEKK